MGASRSQHLDNFSTAVSQGQQQGRISALKPYSTSKMWSRDVLTTSNRNANMKWVRKWSVASFDLFVNFWQVRFGWINERIGCTNTPICQPQINLLTLFWMLILQPFSSRTCTRSGRALSVHNMSGVFPSCDKNIWIIRFKHNHIHTWTQPILYMKSIAQSVLQLFWKNRNMETAIKIESK